MYLAPEGDEVEIANAAAEFLAGVMPINRLHSPNSADLNATLRQLLGKMGWFALAVPKENGGSGQSAVEYVLFFREVGRQCGPVDVLAQALAAIMCESKSMREAFMSGASGVALLVADGNASRLLGSADADHALLVTPDDSSLYPLGNTAMEDKPALDPANSLRIVSALPAAAERKSGRHIWQLGQLGAAAMLLGLGEAALDLIVEYAKVRETFGRPIGSYQAVRHTCADRAVRLEAARAQLWYAAAAMKEGRADAEVHINAAKHLANESAMASVDSNIQLHGGIGVTDEHNAHLLLKHTMVLSRLFGSKRDLLGYLLHARLED